MFIFMASHDHALGTPMFLLARKIKAMGVKMVMSGEGADETLAGYLYFHKAIRIHMCPFTCVCLCHALTLTRAATCPSTGAKRHRAGWLGQIPTEASLG